MDERRKQVNNSKNMEGKMKDETWLDDKGKEITEEYIIVNKTAIEKRIEELEVWSKHNEKVGEYDSEDAIISELKQILSQSIPLIPEIEKAFDSSWFKAHGVMANKEKEKQNYISNLKLNV